MIFSIIVGIQCLFLLFFYASLSLAWIRVCGYMIFFLHQMRLNFRKTTYKQWAKQWHSDTFNKSEVDRGRERKQKRRSISFWWCFCCCYFFYKVIKLHMKCNAIECTYVRTQLNACVCNISNITTISKHSVLDCCCCCPYWPDRITSDCFVG